MPRPVEDNLLRLPRSSKLVAPEKALNLQDPLLLQIDSGEGGGGAWSWAEAVSRWQVLAKHDSAAA